jgi:hypothetical protein
MYPTQVWVASRNFSVYINPAIDGYFIRHWTGMSPNFVKWYFLKDMDDERDLPPLWSFEVHRDAPRLFGPTDRKLELPIHLAEAPASN